MIVVSDTNILSSLAAGDSLPLLLKLFARSRLSIPPSVRDELQTGLDKGMHFRDWIVVDIKLGLPIPGRLYPSHYSLLYFTKGKHKTYHNIRIPIKTCRHCGRDVKDYGGHKKAINPKGVNLTDVWADIPPVRHWKFKSKKRRANALSTKLLERVVEMSTKVGDVVLDPFGGSGTTFAVCEKKKRRWIGIESESTSVIIERLENNDVHFYKNDDFVEE